MQLAATTSTISNCQEGNVVLVVDDEEAVRSLLGLVLERHQCEPLLAVDGLTAVELYREHADRIELVLLDVRMAEVDGPATLLALRQINPRVRCWFMSGYLGEHTLKELLELGAEGVLSKPFDMAALKRVLPRPMTMHTVRETAAAG